MVRGPNSPKAYSLLVSWPKVRSVRSIVVTLFARIRFQLVATYIKMNTSLYIFEIPFLSVLFTIRTYYKPQRTEPCSISQVPISVLSNTIFPYGLIAFLFFGIRSAWYNDYGVWILSNLPHDHLLLDSVPNIGPLISRWELNKFKNCWNKSFRTSKILTLLYQQFSNLLISQRDMSGPRLGARWEINKFENCWYKSVKILKVLKLLFQQFLNLLSSQRDMSGPILGALSNNRWSRGNSWLAFRSRVLKQLVILNNSHPGRERPNGFDPYFKNDAGWIRSSLIFQTGQRRGQMMVHKLNDVHGRGV